MSLALPSKLAVIVPLEVEIKSTAFDAKSAVVSPLPSLLIVGLIDLPEK